MSIFRQVFIANLKEFIRDTSALFWFLAFPIIFIFIFGIVFSGGGEQTFSVGIVNQSVTPVTTKMIEGIKSVPNFNVTTGDKEKEINELKQGKRSLVLVIPEIRGKDLYQGETSEISLYYDGTNNQTNHVLISVIRQIFSEIESKIKGQSRSFKINTQTVQAERLTDFDYILPGILAMSLMQLGLFGGLQFLSLREQGIIRGLGVTPLPRHTLLSSEILIRLIMALIQTFLIVVIGQLVFDVNIIGSMLHVTGLVILGALTFISLGYMVISFASSTESGQGIVQVIQFPMMFLSGIFFPINFMPDYIKPVVKAIPLTYLGDALRQVMVGASPEHAMQTNILVLSAWFLVTLLVGIKFWKWE